MAVKKVTTITISRRWWGRGAGGGALHDSSTHRQCCLGFAARAFGVRRSHIEDIGFPADVEDKAEKARMPEWLTMSRGPAVSRLADINDAENITDETRERDIRAIFKRHGLRVVFTR